MFANLKRRLGLKLNRDEMTFDEVQTEIARLQREIAKLSPDPPPPLRYSGMAREIANLKKLQCNKIH